MDHFLGQAHEAAKTTLSVSAVPGGSNVALVSATYAFRAAIAELMENELGASFFRNVGTGTVAMVTNSSLGVGLVPVGVAISAVAGKLDFFRDRSRAFDLLDGLRRGCNAAGCQWLSTEALVLDNVINDSSIVLSCSAFGYHETREQLSPARVQSGDVIIGIEGASVHEVNIPLAQVVASRLAEGYLTRMPDGKYFGNALLAPAVPYAGLIGHCRKLGLGIKHSIDVARRGWSGLACPGNSFLYLVDQLPAPPMVYNFLQSQAGISSEEAYSDLSMGLAFALFVDPEDALAVIQAAADCGHKALQIGRVCESDAMEVVIEPLGIRYHVV